MPYTTEDPEPLPGYRNYLVYCDECGQSGKTYYGFGSLWMPWERRDFNRLVTQIRERHRDEHEITWHKIDARTEPMYRELMEEFFRRNWLMFHCIVGRQGYIDCSLHEGASTRRFESSSRY